MHSRVDGPTLFAELVEVGAWRLIPAERRVYHLQRAVHAVNA